MFDDIAKVTVNGHEFYEEDLRKSCYISATAVSCQRETANCKAERSSIP